MCALEDFAVTADQEVKMRESRANNGTLQENGKKIDVPCQRAEKDECDSDTNCSWHTWISPQRSRKVTWRNRNQGEYLDHIIYDQLKYRSIR